MKNFDEDEAQFARPKQEKFQLNGREFTHRAGVPAETTGRILDADMGSTMNEIAEFDRFILECLIDEDHDRWKEARRIDAVPPIGLVDLRNVGWWLVEVMMGRPTVSLSGSGGTPTGTTTTLTEQSPSLAGVL